MNKDDFKIATLERKASSLGMTPRQYLLHRAGQNLAEFVNSTAFNTIVALAILISVILIFVEFLLPPGPELEKTVALNDIITCFFIAELSLRYLVAPNKRLFFSNYWVDILAVLPVLRAFRTFRLLRLLRLLRLGRAMLILLSQAGWLSSRLERHFGSFGFLLITAIVLVLCGTLAILTVEGHQTENVEPLQVFAEKVWFSIFLFISGEVLGDLPLTFWGKVISMLISLAGLIIFAVLVGTITAAMTTYFRNKMDTKDLEINDLRGHTLICGWDRMGGLILSELESVPEVWARGVVVIAETSDNIAVEGKVRNARKLFHVKEDFTKMDVLERVGVTRARSAIVLADRGAGLKDQDRDARTVLAALTLEKLNPNIFTCAELLDEVNATHLKIAGVEEIISRASLTAGLFASTVVNRGITSVISDLLTHREGMYLRRFRLPEEFIGRKYIDVFEYFKRRYEATVLAIDSRNRDGDYERSVNPNHQRELQAGDMVVVVAKADSDLRHVS